MALILSGDTGPSFVQRAAMPTGSVIQTVSVVKTDTFAGSIGAVWLDLSGLSASITPTSATNKILVTVDVKGSGSYGTSIIRTRLLRDSTPVYVGDAAGSRPQSLGQFYIGSAADNIHYLAQLGGSYVDSPATTSTITYKIQIGSDGVSQTVYVNRTQGDRDNAYFDSRSAASITLMEIAA